MNNRGAERVLDYWFGVLDEHGVASAEKSRMWFEKSEKTDAWIRSEFGADVEGAMAGDYDHWLEDIRSRLALIILLDQFSRNIYRNSPQAFASDGRALAACIEGCDQKWDQLLAPIERVFFYLPMEHAEDLAMQDRSVSTYQQLHEQAEAPIVQQLAGYLDYAEKHRVVIRRFGRFPHRNEILGRDNTEEETSFLGQPGSRF